MATPIFDANMMNAFIDGAVNVLATMCQTPANPGKPLLKKDHKLTGDVSGSIPLTGVAQRGIAILSFSEAAILTIVSRMLFEEIKEVNAEIKDAVGELTNMVAGDSRKRLQSSGLKLEAGIPTVVIGKNHEVFTMVSESAPTIILPFTIDTGATFTVEFTLEALPK